MVEQALGKFDAARHPARESLYQVARPVGEADTGENLPDACFQRGTMQAVKVALVPEIFVGGELAIDARSLKHDPNMAAEAGGVASGIVAQHDRASGAGDHQ